MIKPKLPNIQFTFELNGEQYSIDLKQFHAEPGNIPQLSQRLADCAKLSAIIATITAHKKAELEIAQLDFDEFVADNLSRIKQNNNKVTVTEAKKQVTMLPDYRRHEMNLIKLRRDVEIFSNLNRIINHFGTYLQTLIRIESNQMFSVEPHDETFDTEPDREEQEENIGEINTPILNNHNRTLVIRRKQ